MIWAGVAVFSFTTLQEINRQRRIKELISCVVKEKIERLRQPPASFSHMVWITNPIPNAGDEGRICLTDSCVIQTMCEKETVGRLKTWSRSYENLNMKTKDETIMPTDV